MKDVTRNFGLDVVRAAAIIFVIVCHYLMGYAWSFQLGQAPYGWTTIGFVGVGLFFPLSGYLLANILFKIFDEDPSSKTVVRFFIRRWMRTVPCYLIVLIVTYKAAHYLGYNRIHLLEFTFFVQNFFTPYPGSFFGVSWSLSVEEWFYVLFPTLLLLLYALKIRNFLVYAILIFLVAPAIARYLMLDHAQLTGLTTAGYTSYWDSAIRKQVPLQLDSIGYGVLAAYLTRNRQFGTAPTLIIGLGGVALLAASWFTLVGNVLDHNTFWVANAPFWFVSIGSALTVVAFSRLEDASGPLAALVRIVSRHSYTLYLVHVQCFDSLGVFAVRNGLPTSTVSLLAIPFTALCAAALTRFVEQPIMRLRPAQFRSEAERPAARAAADPVAP